MNFFHMVTDHSYPHLDNALAACLGKREILGLKIKISNKPTFVGLSHGAHRIQNFLQENERKQTDLTRGIHFDFD